MHALEAGMPDYLAPGVYVVEGDAAPKPIRGVPTGTDDAALRTVADTLREQVAVFAPEWTGSNESDPGVTLLELFAFLTESLLDRADLLPERGRTSALRLAMSALRISGRRACRLVGWRALFVSWIAR